MPGPSWGSGPVTVRVPATSANLGPGFDSLGLALRLRDEVVAQVLGGTGPGSVTVTGEGAGQVPTDQTHLVYASMLRGFAAMGLTPPAISLSCRNVIPHGRGLGSSSAAIVAGVEVARALVADGHDRLSSDDALALAADIEGHPDNVAPAALGGLTVAFSDDGRFRAVSAPLSADLGFVAYVPPVPLPTTAARDLLPETVPHRDASFNAGRTALLMTALAARADLLLTATEDRLHQPYRFAVMPESARLIAALRHEGVAAVVSGAGPSVLALGKRQLIAPFLTWAPAGWRALVLDVDTEGVRSSGSPTATWEAATRDT